VEEEVVQEDLLEVRYKVVVAEMVNKMDIQMLAVAAAVEEDIMAAAVEAVVMIMEVQPEMHLVVEEDLVTSMQLMCLKVLLEIIKTLRIGEQQEKLMDLLV
jgi:hypothetical protein